MDDEKNSRINKFEKRRKNTKMITYSLSLASVLIVVLLGFWIFGGGDEESPSEIAQNENGGFFLDTDESEENTEVNSDSNGFVSDESDESNASADEETNIENDESEETEQEIADENYEIEQIQSEEENVISAYTADWPASGTTQTGPHTTDYSDGSQDRIEIRRAISVATGLPEDDIVEIWIGNGGDQKVVATVSNSLYTENYRVYLDWLDGEGWKPTSVEVLRELDV